MTTPTPHEQVPEALTYERDRAIMEGERNASLDAYSRVVLLTSAESRLYEAAFTNGWDRCATHVQNPAENEHVAGNVLKNGAEVNMNVYAELPEPDATTVGLGAVWNRHSMRDFADATHALRTQQPAPATQQTGEVHGDLLPKIGSRVFIRHGRDEHAHACIVTGYYAWGDLKGDKRLHRVFVRMAYEGTSIEQARMLCDCYPTAGAALAAAPQPSPTAQAAPAAGAVAGPTDDEILNRTGTPYAPGTREYDLDLIRWYRERLAAAPTPAAQAAESVPATANNKLLPCPCCGGEAAEHDRFNSNTVRCLSCGLRAKQSEMGMGDAAARWNTRAAHPAAGRGGAADG